MPVNSDKPKLWKADIAKSVDQFNAWFVEFAPKAFRDSRATTTAQVAEALKLTGDLSGISASTLRAHPGILPVLRMACCPPLARDRLIGLASANKSFVLTMEGGKLPPRADAAELDANLGRLSAVVTRMLDRDIFPWLAGSAKPSEGERLRAATIVADRLCGAVSDPIIRNAQEQRQLAAIRAFLEADGYVLVPFHSLATPADMAPETFSFRANLTVGGKHPVKLPIDVLIQPRKVRRGGLPLMIEAKSAGDFTNTNKRRKEEAAKAIQLRSTFGKNVQYVLFLCGYFDSGYLGYEAAEGIDWVWEHRIGDLKKLGV